MKINSFRLLKVLFAAVALLFYVSLPIVAAEVAPSQAATVPGGGKMSPAGNTGIPVVITPGEASATGTMPLPAQTLQSMQSGSKSGSSLEQAIPPSKTEGGKAEQAVQKSASSSLPQVVEVSAIEKTFAGDAQTASNAGPQSLSITRIEQFGYNFFRNDATGFAPLTDVQVGPDYLIGVGDRIGITMWGSIDAAFEFEVNRSGEIVLPKVGSVKVAGTSFGQLQPVLRAHLSKIYKDFQLNVNLGKLHLIKVYLVGDVKSPGDYNISSMATLLNALAAAGGPTKSGSLRAIQIKRHGKLVEIVDLYDFFLNGDKSKDIRLQAGDTIFVPSIGPVAGIAGNVRRSAIYELKGEKTLGDLLSLADGISPGGYLQRIQLSRLVAHEKKIVTDFNLDPANTGKSLAETVGNVMIQDMDMVRIFPIDATLRGYARLSGYVLRPGDYALKPEMRLADLLLPDNLLPEYNDAIAQLTRLFPPDFHQEKIFIDLKKALSGDKGQNLVLQEFDDLRIFSRSEMEELPIVTISGEVLRPGKFRLTKNETVSDLVKEAGNLKRLAFTKKAEVRRIRFDQEQLKPYSVYINLEEALAGNQQHNIFLAPFDEVVIKKFDAEAIRIVRANGEIQRPGEYRFVENMTVADLVMEAGGLKLSSFVNNAELTRFKIATDKITSSLLTIDLGEALSGSPVFNVKLEPFDELTVRRIPNWSEDTARYITLKGEFRFPGTYPVIKGERLSNVIKRAGGFTEKAYLPSAKFTRVALKEMQQSRMDEVLTREEVNLSRKQSELSGVATSKEELDATRASIEGLQKSIAILRTKKAEGRMLINLLSEEDLARNREFDFELLGGDTLEVSIDPKTVTVLGQVYNPNTFLYVKGDDVVDYLAKAGGFTRDAETADAYVIKSDGTVVSRQMITGFLGIGSFMSKNMDSGDTLVVPQKLERIAWIRELKDVATVIGQLALAAGVIIAIH